MEKLHDMIRARIRTEALNVGLDVVRDDEGRYGRVTFNESYYFFAPDEERARATLMLQRDTDRLWDATLRVVTHAGTSIHTHNNWRMEHSEGLGGLLAMLRDKLPGSEPVYTVLPGLSAISAWSALRARFRWGLDEEINGADVVDFVNSIFDSLFKEG